MESLDELLNLGSIATRLITSQKAKGISKQQESAFLREAVLNKRIGIFNSEVANRTGMASVIGIMHETSSIMGKQIMAFSNRGISLEGSPMMVLGETVAMGEKRAQEAMFNADVQAINYRFHAEIAEQHALNGAEKAKASAMMQNINQAKTTMDSLKLLSSMGGGNPITGLVNGVTNGLSSIGTIFKGLMS
jgi:hypothetical protein